MLLRVYRKEKRTKTENPLFVFVRCVAIRRACPRRTIVVGEKYYSYSVLYVYRFIHFVGVHTDGDFVADVISFIVPYI